MMTQATAQKGRLEHLLDDFTEVHGTVLLGMKGRERGEGRILQTKVLPRPDSRLGGSYAAANSNR